MGGGRDSSVTVTNDGATILKAIGVDNPAAKVLVGQFPSLQDSQTRRTLEMSAVARGHITECFLSSVLTLAVIR